jgi:hypothetical protein
MNNLISRVASLSEGTNFSPVFSSPRHRFQEQAPSESNPEGFEVLRFQIDFDRHVATGVTADLQPLGRISWFGGN